LLLFSLLVGAVVSVQIADKFDSRTAFPKCVGQILNQGSCGSCWSFGAAESFTDRNCIFGKTEFQSQNQLSNSPEDIVACDTEADGCNGGWAQSAWSIIAGGGISTCTDTCFSGCQPYTPYNVLRELMVQIMDVNLAQEHHALIIPSMPHTLLVKMLQFLPTTVIL